MGSAPPGSNRQPPSLSAGTLLSGRYRLDSPIDSGGMATVWSAHDEVLQRQVAVKLALYDDITDLGPRLQHEAQTAGRLRHDDIVEIYDYGEAALDEAGGPVPFIVMELLPGRTLDDRLCESAPSSEEGAAICLRVAGAVAAAHRAGVVHRDLNPRNIMLTASGVTVLDFGISFTSGARSADGRPLGTRGYAAPEVLRGALARQPADVHALGVLIGAVLAPADPSVKDLVERCTTRDPAERPSAEALVQLLRDRYPDAETWVWSEDSQHEGEDKGARQARPTDPPTTQPHPMTPRALAFRRFAPRRRTALAVGLVAGPVVLFALGAALAASSPSQDSPESPPAAAPETSPEPEAAVEGAGVPPLPALDTAEDLVEGGEAAGQIRPDVALDLRQVIAGVREAAIQRGGTLTTEEVTGLREKVQQRAQEDGALEPEQADLLLEALAAEEAVPATTS